MCKPYGVLSGATTNFKDMGFALQQWLQHLQDRAAIIFAGL